MRDERAVGPDRRVRTGWGHRMQWCLGAGATAVAIVVLVWAGYAAGPDSVAFSFLVVWVPMAWLGTISRFVRPRLPHRIHELRGWESSGRIYEFLGVRGAKRMLRRGPFAAFNPKLHLPTHPTPERLRHLDQAMVDAEASHLILLAATAGITAYSAFRGWWLSAVLTLVFNLIMNGYPVMLQRYNRALLRRRWLPSEAPVPGFGPEQTR